MKVHGLQQYRKKIKRIWSKILKTFKTFLRSKFSNKRLLFDINHFLFSWKYGIYFIGYIPLGSRFLVNSIIYGVTFYEASIKIIHQPQHGFRRQLRISNQVTDLGTDKKSKHHKLYQHEFEPIEYVLFKSRLGTKMGNLTIFNPS